MLRAGDRFGRVMPRCQGFSFTRFLASTPSQPPITCSELGKQKTRRVLTQFPRAPDDFSFIVTRCERKMEQLMNSYQINGRRKRLCAPFASRARVFCAENLPPHMRESAFRVTTKRKPSNEKHTDDTRLLLSLLFLPIEGQRPCFYLFIFFPSVDARFVVASCAKPVHKALHV